MPLHVSSALRLAAEALGAYSQLLERHERSVARHSWQVLSDRALDGSAASACRWLKQGANGCRGFLGRAARPPARQVQKAAGDRVGGLRAAAAAAADRPLLLFRTLAAYFGAAG